MLAPKSTFFALAAFALGSFACAAGDEPTPTSARSGGTVDGGGSGGQNTGGQGTGGTNGGGGKDASGATGGSGTGGTSLDAGGAAGTDAALDGGADATPDGIADATRDVIADASDGGDGGDGGPPGNTGSVYCNMDVVTVPDTAALNILGDWTAEAWFADNAPTGPGGQFDHGGESIMGKGNGPDGQFLFDVAWESVSAQECSNWARNSVSYDLNANGYKRTTWIHMAATFSAASKALTLFVNGVQVGQNTNAPASVAVNTSPLLICGGLGNAWTGWVDDVRIWNVVRTPVQISANYKTELTTFPAALVAYWKFNEGSGTVAHDATGHGHDGTLGVHPLANTEVRFSAAHP
jgi:hypothetical protein